jgi:hypothetical protein
MHASDTDTARDLFIKVFEGKGSPRTLKWEGGYWGGTLNRWYAEGMEKRLGLPKVVQFGETIVGPASPYPAYGVNGDIIREKEASGFFGLDEGFLTMPFNYWIDPVFEKVVVSEDESSVEMYGEDGIRTRNFKDSSSMPMWLEFPVKDWKSWEKVKEERFSLKNIRQRFRADVREFAAMAKQRDYPLGILNNPVGFFGSIRSLVGEEQLFLLYYDDPSLVRDICEHLYSLWMASLEELLGVGIEYDIAFFWEDMSGNAGSLISPSTFRAFMSPYYKKMIDYMRARGVKNFIVDTDGKIGELIKLFMEVGINVLYPCERRAGNDLMAIRKEYPELGMLGGVDKTMICQGKKATDEELAGIRDLIQAGRFVPFFDHLVPPNCSWEDFQYYRNGLNKIIESTKIAR